VRGVSRQTARQILLERPPAHPFPIYTGNADRIGELQADDAQAVVEFFTCAARIVSSVNEAVRGQAQSFANRDENANSLSNILLADVLASLEQNDLPKALSCATRARELLLRTPQSKSTRRSIRHRLVL